LENGTYKLTLNKDFFEDERFEKVYIQRYVRGVHDDGMSSECICYKKLEKEKSEIKGVT